MPHLFLRSAINTISCAISCALVLAMFSAGTAYANNDWLDMSISIIDKAPHVKKLSTNEAISLDDYPYYRHNLTLADSRYMNDWHMDIGIENWSFWGLSGGYYINQSLYMGMGVYSLNFIRIFSNKDKNIRLSTKITSLDPNYDYQIELKPKNDFLYYHLFLRFFPLENSGFFTQIGLNYNQWDLTTPITLQPEGANQAQSTPPNQVGTAVIATNKPDLTARIGWSWISSYGFSSTIGLGKILQSNSTITINSSQNSVGGDLLSIDERNNISSKISSDLLAFNMDLIIFLSFGIGL